MLMAQIFPERNASSSRAWMCGPNLKESVEDKLEKKILENTVNYVGSQKLYFFLKNSAFHSLKRVLIFVKKKTEISYKHLYPTSFCGTGFYRTVLAQMFVTPHKIILYIYYNNRRRITPKFELTISVHPSILFAKYRSQF